MKKTSYFHEFFLLVLSILFTVWAKAAPLCSSVFSINHDNDAVIRGLQTTHYYSGFGSSYGKDPLLQLKGYLEIGARLSPRGWDLFQRIKVEAKPPISDKELARAIVVSLHPETPHSQEQISALRRSLRSDRATEIILQEIDSIRKDIEVFKSNAKDVFELFDRIQLFHHQNRNEPKFRRSLQELKSFKKTATYRRYSASYIPIYQQRWSDSFEPIDDFIFKGWEQKLESAKNEAVFRSLSSDARELLDMQLQRKAGGLFYSNYGGLYNKKDRSLVWYASGERDFSRESFDSIQSFFAKGGVTFEFNNKAKRRILWDQTLSLERKNEVDNLTRAGFTFDVVSMSGNLIPDDVSRVYASTPELLAQVKEVFEEILGPSGMQNNQLSFHLSSEQSGIHEKATMKIISDVNLGSDRIPEVKPVFSGSSTYFLSNSEIQNIKDRKRPLKFLIRLNDDKKGLTSLKKLIERHSQVSLRTSVQNAELLTGGYLKNPDGTFEYLTPGQEISFIGGDHIYLEIRPEVSKSEIEALISNGFNKDFDFRIISRIYFPDSTSAGDARSFYFSHFGIQNLYKWSQKFDSVRNAESNYLADWIDFQNGLAQNARSLNLDQAHSLEINLDSFRKSVNLFDLPTYEKVRKFLLSSQNFGIAPYLNLKKNMRKYEYEVWTKLQDLVLLRAKQRQPLTIELVDEFLLLAAQSSRNHAPVGYRVDKSVHEIWPGGRKLGDNWLFNLQETQHFYREPFFEVPDVVYRSSPTELIVNKLSYRSPGDLHDQIKGLIQKYSEVKVTHSAELAAFLFYKDLIALHPLTDGNGRGSRALLSYLLLSEGIPAPSFEKLSIADLYVTGQEAMSYLEMGVWRGWQSISFGGPPINK